VALNAVIAKALKDLVASDARLAVMLPGDLHYGRADTSAVRPFGTVMVEERGREYESGGGALVEYELTLTIYGKQSGWDVAEILQGFAAVMNMGGWLPVLPTGVGTVLSILPTGSTVTEDDTEEFGKDVMVGRSTWLMNLNVYETILA